MNQCGKFIIGRIDGISELAQGVQKSSLRSLVHARNTSEAVYPAAEADQSGEETGGGACVADEKLERVCGSSRRGTVPPRPVTVMNLLLFSAGSGSTSI